MPKFSVLVVALLAVSACAQQQSVQTPMSARDVFWSASDLVSVAPNPGATSASAAKPPTTASKPKTTKPPVKHQLNPEVVAANGYGAQPHLVSLTSDRIGLRYTLLQEGSDGGFSEVLPSTVFHSGERVRLSIMANHTGYLYLIQQGSSGAWSPIYPNPGAARDSNFVEPGKVYEIPGDGAFEFNQQPGNEHLFIVLSVNPITDLDGAIFGLQDHNAAPPSNPTPVGTGTTLEADNRITDALIQRLTSRDLIPVQEQVNTPSASIGSNPQPGEKAVYVVNSVSADAHGSRVVASLVLDHQ